MIVGFTGTRAGLTDRQRGEFWRWYVRQRVAEFHTGCCVGADSEAVRIAYVTTPPAKIVGHPGDLPAYTCEAAKSLCHELRGPLPNLVRNRNIVGACSVIAACPGGPEELRSGTWATVRFARRVGRQVVLFWPDGTVTEEPL